MPFDPAELPRPTRELKAGLTPQEAADYMSVPEGFLVSLAAGEPQVHQPIAFTIDERGRLWVAEAYTYPLRAPEGEGKDKIIILEDTDRDGTLDARTVFLDGLNLVSGIEVGFGGVYIGAAPYLLFVPDRDRDDRPDGRPEVLLDGWGYQDTHETLNSFIWGPDGWLYGCHGVFTHSRVGQPGTPDDQRTPLNAGVWRYHPVRHEFEVFAWGTSNPWGVDFNDYGQAFITACVIPHLWHVIQGGRYQRQGGQHFDPYVFADIRTIADHSHYAGDIRDHAWWGNEPAAPPTTLDAGGGHAHCGAMVYLGDNWPARYRNQIFMHNIHGNRINCDHLHRRGSGYVGEHGPDLLLANDRWFRGIGLRYGPDGSVWSLDWYDPNACHRVTPEIWDRTNGRIYNISYGTPRRKPIDLAQLSDLQLAELQAHPNDWMVRTARRLLQERASAGRLSPAAVKHLRSSITFPASVPQRLRAVWALHAAGRLSRGELAALGRDANEHLRAWSIQLELEDRQVDRRTLSQWEMLAKEDASPVVRLSLASGLQRMPVEDRWTIAGNLIRRGEDAEDHNLPLMIWYGIEPLVPSDPERALALAEQAQIPLLRRFLYRRAAAEPASLNALVAHLAGREDAAAQRVILQEMQRAFEGRVNLPMPETWSGVYEELVRSSSPEVMHLADEIAVVFGDQRVFPRMRAIVTDRSAEMTRRAQALSVLIRGQDAGAAETFIAVLDEPALRKDAIRALARFDDAAVPEAILHRYSRLTETERQDAVATLAGRRNSAERLLSAIEQGRVPRTDLHAFHIEQMLQLGGGDLKDRIEQVWGAVRETDVEKQARIAELKQTLTPQLLRRADAGRGRMVFSRVCATCHRLFDAGERLAPDLTGSNRANLDYILQNVIDPSAVLGRDYQQTVIVTDDGRVVSGLVQKETDTAVTVRTINDTVVIPRASIDERTLSDKSMMPERLLDPLSLEEVRDLVAYLSSPRQVPIKGPPAPIDEATGRVPGAIEAHTLPVTRITAGRVRPQTMEEFTADRWSGADHLWWTDAAPGDALDLEFSLEEGGLLAPEVVLTRAFDYAVVQLHLDGEPLGEPIDLYHNPQVVTTGVLSFAPRMMSAGKHTLTLEITGANPQAQQLYMAGIDYLRFVSPSDPRD